AGPGDLLRRAARARPPRRSGPVGDQARAGGGGVALGARQQPRRAERGDAPEARRAPAVLRPLGREPAAPPPAAFASRARLELLGAARLARSLSRLRLRRYRDHDDLDVDVDEAAIGRGVV